MVRQGGGMAYAAGLKPAAPQGAYGFKSRPWHSLRRDQRQPNCKPVDIRLRRPRSVNPRGRATHTVTEALTVSFSMIQWQSIGSTESTRSTTLTSFAQQRCYPRTRRYAVAIHRQPNQSLCVSLRPRPNADEEEPHLRRPSTATAINCEDRRPVQRNAESAGVASPARVPAG